MNFIMMMPWHENTCHITGPLREESIGHQWILPHPVMQIIDIFFVVSLNTEQSFEQTIKLLVIRDSLNFL